MIQPIATNVVDQWNIIGGKSSLIAACAQVSAFVIAAVTITWEVIKHRKLKQVQDQYYSIKFSLWLTDAARFILETKRLTLVPILNNTTILLKFPPTGLPEVMDLDWFFEWRNRTVPISLEVLVLTTELTYYINRYNKAISKLGSPITDSTNYTLLINLHLQLQLWHLNSKHSY